MHVLINYLLFVSFLLTGPKNLWPSKWWLLASLQHRTLLMLPWIHRFRTVLQSSVLRPTVREVLPVSNDLRHDLPLSNSVLQWNNIRKDMHLDMQERLWNNRWLVGYHMPVIRGMVVVQYNILQTTKPTSH